MLSAVCLSIQADTLSRPVAFMTSSDVRRSKTSASVHKRQDQDRYQEDWVYQQDVNRTAEL